MPRLVTVGRLDFNREGLILLTNDGGIARALELPATGWIRRYRVRAHGDTTQQRFKGCARHQVEGIAYGAIEATLDRPQGRIAGSRGDARGQQPRGPQRLRRARAEGEPADPGPTGRSSSANWQPAR